MAAPYKVARPCSNPAAPRDNLSPLDFPPDMWMGAGRPVEEGLRGGYPPPLKTFLLEASLLEAGNSVLSAAGSDHCTVVVGIVLRCPPPLHRCIGCRHGTSVGA